MSEHPIIAPKKLIEVALPLDEINKACAREKSIRHGHPSTLHLWWARRPLAAARAVLFAQLVNDPSWKYSEEELKKPQIKSAITRKRNELFKLITELVQWENTTNEDVLDRARKEIRSSWKETCEANKDHPEADTLFDPEQLPAFHDPFAGGGAIPLEAQRLGLEAHASDLNPVAVLINKAMIEIPPRFSNMAPVGPPDPNERQVTVDANRWLGARGLAEDVRRYGAWVATALAERIGNIFPGIEITDDVAAERPDLSSHVGQRLTVIAWVWARTVKSPNPATAQHNVPLVTSFVLAKKPGKAAWVEPLVVDDGYRFVVRRGDPPEHAHMGTKLSGRGANFECLLSKSPITPEYIRAEGKAGRIGSRLMAIVAEGQRRRVYLSPTQEHEHVAKGAHPPWKPDVAFMQEALGFRVGTYGLTRWSDLFSGRQTLALVKMSDLVQEVASRCRVDAVKAGLTDDGVRLTAGGTGAQAYADAVSLYLAFAVDKCSEALSTLCTWSAAPKNELVVSTFRRQALPMTWDWAEANPLARSSGSFAKAVDAVAKATEAFCPMTRGTAAQENAQNDGPIGVVLSTDPPYYDNIGYADLSDYFYVWLRRSVYSVFPTLFSTLAVPKGEELVATPHRHGGRAKAEAFFLDGMTVAMRNFARRSHPGMPTTIYYAFKQSDTTDEAGTSSTGWETFLQAMLNAGLTVTGTWPARTERSSRGRGIGSNALASSIVLVARPRGHGARSAARRDFLRQLQSRLPIALAEMTSDPAAAVAPVDLAQAAIGPGMAIFSQFASVLEADGSAMTIRNALVHVNRMVDEYFALADGDLDADTRFCVSWFQQYGFETGTFGEGDVLARAKGTSVDGLKEAGVLAATSGKVRLMRIDEYPQGWDPTADGRTPVWEACQHMCRRLAESERAAGELLARMPTRQDPIRQLAYRLYTICERKRWAEEARAYNELIMSWPAIVEHSLAAGHVWTQTVIAGVEQ